MTDKLLSYINWPRVEALVYGEESSPRDVLAPRLLTDGILVQAFFPGATSCTVVNGKREFPMSREYDPGYFAVLMPGRRIPSYKLRVTYGERVLEVEDPYAQPGFVTEEQEKAFLAGTLYDGYQVFGAHPDQVGEVEGYRFAVWAPNARRVSLVGPFNDWNPVALPLHRSPMTGIFSLFVPGMKGGEPYLYDLLLPGGESVLRLDPYGQETRFMEVSGLPLVSVTPEEVVFTWEDEAYLESLSGRAEQAGPLSILEVDPSQYESLDQVAEEAIAEGFGYVELTPVMEYLQDASAGYSTAAYFSITHRIGGVLALKRMVNRLHKAGIGVILDWTPAQFPRFAGGLECFDGTPLYEIKDKHYAIHPKWGTMLYNYDSPMVKDFLISNAFYLLDELHADGLRMDDVDAMLYLDFERRPGEWTRNLYGGNENLEAVSFLSTLHSLMRKNAPGTISIAQEDGLWPQLTSKEEGQVGFSYKWSGGFTSDLLSYLRVDPIFRKDYHDQLSLSMLYSYCESFVLTLGRRDVGSLGDFAASFPVREELKMAQLREAITYLFLHPGGKMVAAWPKASQEFVRFLRELNDLYRGYPALYLLDEDFEGFEWVQLTKYEENVIAFLRKTQREEETLLAVVNFAAVPYEDYEVGVPFHGKYKEIFNSDQVAYGGSGRVNARMKTSRALPCDERDESIRIQLGALSAAVFTCTPATKPERKAKDS